MTQEHIESVVEFINHILNKSGLGMKASAEQAGDELRIEVRGPDVSLLLGHNAELLDALEYLGNRLLARLAGEETKLVFDSNNYRAVREKELRLMAAKAAERVRHSRIPFSLDPMTPNERRIIHLTLAEDTTVKTESQGNGENRKVTIYPA